MSTSDVQKIEWAHGNFLSEVQQIEVGLMVISGLFSGSQTNRNMFCPSYSAS